VSAWNLMILVICHPHKLGWLMQKLASFRGIRCHLLFHETKLFLGACFIN